MAFRRRAPKAPPAPPELAPLTISESQWRGQQLEAARALVERYRGEAAIPPTLASLDDAVAGWFDDDAPDRPHVNDLVTAVGVALGHHVAKATGLTWVMATDEAGTELALSGQPGEVLIFPPNLVAERIVDDQHRFVEAAHAELVARVREAQASA